MARLPRVEDPDVLRRIALLKKDDVGFHALAIWRKRAARQTENRVQIAVLHHDLEHFAGLVFKKTVVGQHYGGAAAGFQDRQDVLNEVELLIRSLDGEVFTIGRLVRSLGAERRIGQDYVEAAAVRDFVD